MPAKMSGVLAVAVGGGLLLASLFGALSGVAYAQPLAATHYVAPSGQCGSNAPCYAHPQAAVDAAGPGDEIRVAAGTYSGVSTRNGSTQILYVDKQVTVRGGYDPGTWVQDLSLHTTILDAQKQGRVLYITGQVAPVIEGLHLTQGSGPNGGGVYVEGAAVTLRSNEIYGNWTEGFGGGIYLKNSAATVTGNHIYTNTTAASGRGGGVALTDSPAEVADNLIEDNRAHVGGGVIVNSTLSTHGALLTGNTIRNNVAFDLKQDGRTFDGAGGGIDLSSYLTDTLRNNTISGNTARWGGGVHAFGAAAAIVDNTFQANNAPTHGGGLYVQGGWISLENNKILSNTAGSWGGGLTLLVNIATVKGNTLRGNTSAWRGGGMYASGSAQFDGNLFLDNVATEQGGGIFLNRLTGAVFENSVFVGNHAAEGGGLYLWSVDILLFYSTIANNSSGDGRAVVIDKYPGLVSPEQPTMYTSTVVFRESIIAGQPVGIFVTPDNSLTVEGVLWHAVATHIDAEGATVSVGNEYEGDPLFYPDGYHLQETNSAAQDRGVTAGLDHDVDGNLRPTLGGVMTGGRTNLYDLGADEIVPIAKVTPKTGGNVTFFDISGMTMTVLVPPNAILSEIMLQLAPIPPSQIGRLPFPNKLVGPGFQLNPFLNGSMVPGITPTKPVSVTLDASQRITELMAYMDMRSVQFMSFFKTKSTLGTQNAACGPEQQNPVAARFSSLLCRIGPPPRPPLPLPDPTIRRVEFQAAVGFGEEDSIIYGFVAPSVELTLYLPLMMRQAP